MRFQTLPQWLEWQENLHFTEIDPGLERVGQVWQQLGGNSKLPFTVITVAGTNGKGSSVAMLSSILSTAGYRTGTYTSPHLLRYNERICIDGIASSDEMICAAFNRIDHIRNDTSLTYFEFATLAAVDIFCKQQVDIAILEVGMGGRLDAVNLFDTDLALITPISLDHIRWLGNTREKIAYEKAGVLRPNKPVVCSESSPPNRLLRHAASLQAPTYIAESDFKFNKDNSCWHWSNDRYDWKDLPLPALVGAYQLQNAAAVLQIISLLIDQNHKISTQNVKAGLITVQLAGRFQQIQGDVKKIFDVTHNQQGAENLVKLLTEIPNGGRTFAILAMLKDKDVSAVVSPLQNSIDAWYVAGLGEASRGMSVTNLASQVIPIIHKDRIKQFKTIESAYKKAMNDAQAGDRLLIFGSFLTVQAILISDEFNKYTGEH